jgi:hypothetical protein
MDTSPSNFGFVPKTYLQFERTTGTDNATPTGGAGKEAKDLLEDIYSMTEEEKDARKRMSMI